MRYSPSGGSYVRVFSVFGLLPNAANLFGAIQVADSSTGFSVPKYAEPCVIQGSVIQGFFMSDYETEPIQDSSRTGVKVYCIYRTDDWLGYATFIEVIGSNGTKVMSRWAFGPNKGQPIIVGYSPDNVSFTSPINPFTVANEPEDSNKFYSLVGVEVLSPNMILKFTRRESVSPVTLSHQYRHCVNSDSWQGGEPGTWLCRAIDGKNLPIITTLFPGGGWQNEYLFEYDPDGWVQYGLFHDLNTGAVPQDIDFTDGTNNGYQRIVPYPTAAFGGSDLHLPSALT